MKSSEKNELPVDSAFCKTNRLLNNFKIRGLAAFQEMNKDERKLIIDWSKNVTRQYINLIDTDPSNIRTIADLPYTKEDIKLAIKIMLSIYISSGPPKMVKQLKLGYQELGSFLDIDPDNYKIVQSLATSKDTNSSKMTLEGTTLFDKYMELAISERKILLQEIENYVNSLKNIIQDEK
jgi:hypothetical protein